MYEMPDADVVNAVIVCGFARPLLIPMGDYAKAAPFGNAVLDPTPDEDDDSEEAEVTLQYCFQ